jgi:hypothetical protein
MAEEIKLPPEHKERMKHGIESTYALEKFLNRAQLAGIDVKHLQDQNVADRNKLTQLKSAFFPEL